MSFIVSRYIPRRTHTSSPPCSIVVDLVSGGCGGWSKGYRISLPALDDNLYDVRAKKFKEKRTLFLLHQLLRPHLFHPPCLSAAALLYPHLRWPDQTDLIFFIRWCHFTWRRASKYLLKVKDKFVHLDCRGIRVQATPSFPMAYIPLLCWSSFLPSSTRKEKANQRTHYFLTKFLYSCFCWSFVSSEQRRSIIEGPYRKCFTFPASYVNEL